jgi:glycosyltransferase involved in cell wall biosynthesis
MEAPCDSKAILLWLPWAFGARGGVVHVVQALVRELVEAGHRVVVLENTGGDFEPVRSVPPVFKVDLRNPREDVHPWKGLVAFCIRTPRVVWKLWTLCRQYDLDVLNPHFVGLEHLPFVLLKRLGLFRGKLVFSFHGADLREMFQATPLEKRLLRMMLRNADALVCCSEGLREELVLFAPEVEPRAAVVHNGVDIPRLLSATEPAFGFPERFRGRKVILNIGAFEFKKAHDTLLQAFSLLRRRRSDVALAIAGQRSSIETARLAAQLGVADDVAFFEDLSHGQVLGLLTKADLFVLSSRWKKGVYGEGFAMALLEAGAASKPVVSTLSCGVAELIADGDTGWVVPVDDPEALAAAIEAGLSDSQTAARFAARLHQRVSESFTWSQARDRYLDIVRA